MEIGDGLVQQRGRKIGQHALEIPECPGRLVDLLWRLGALVSNRAFDEEIRAPVFALGIAVAGPAGRERHQGQRLTVGVAPRGADLGAQVSGNALDVFLHLPRLTEHVLVDALQDIAFLTPILLPEAQAQRIVDVPRAVRLDREQLPMEGKLRNGQLHRLSG